ncbi:MAG: hypothetical protein JXB34_03820 [Bacteroidales bacterium]|nr:hypothetical protein [Bacteroidales bacterium]
MVLSVLYIVFRKIFYALAEKQDNCQTLIKVLIGTGENPEKKDGGRFKV